MVNESIIYGRKVFADQMEFYRAADRALSTARRSLIEFREPELSWLSPLPMSQCYCRIYPGLTLLYTKRKRFVCAPIVITCRMIQSGTSRAAKRARTRISLKLKLNEHQKAKEAVSRLLYTYCMYRNKGSGCWSEILSCTHQPFTLDLHRIT